MNEASWYYDKDRVQSAVDNGTHRNAIGGMWDEVGTLQFQFLKVQGLDPSHKLLDVGCGCLRGGVHFVEYLNAGNYFGIDLNKSLLDAGQKELASLNLSSKCNPENLHATKNFDASIFNEQFDFALAVSVFTHLPLNNIRIALEKLAPVLKTGGVFYATIFECPENAPTHIPIAHSPGDITTLGDADPYHYRIEDIEFVTKNLPWDFHYIGDINHPRSQRMARFTKK